MWKPIRHWELELWSSTSHWQNFSKILFILINFTSPFPLAPYNLSLICTVLFQQYPQKTQQWLLNKPNGLFWSLYSPWLPGNISLSKIPPLTFFPLLFLVSLHWHFLKCFLQISGPKDEIQKNIYGQLILPNTALLEVPQPLLPYKVSVKSDSKRNLHNCGNYMISNFLDYGTHFIKVHIISSCLRHTCLSYFNIFDSSLYLITNSIFKSLLAGNSHEVVGNGHFLSIYKHG